jgi:DNA-binding response OmpR family regulator
VSRTVRVLVVEDEPMIALMIEDAIAALGCEMVGPISSLDEALEAAGREDFDCALLDVNIRGGHVFPVADLLLARGTPFLLSTGYSRSYLPDPLSAAPMLAKPYTSEQLETGIDTLCRRVRDAAAPRTDVVDLQ